MAFQKVSAKVVYHKYAECKPGQKLVDEGVYKGPIEGKFGIEHKFIQTNGETVILNSSGHLNWLMENKAMVGSMCNVYYKEKTKLTKGKFAGKDSHNFELEIDNERFNSQAPEAAAPEMPAGTSDISM